MNKTEERYAQRLELLKRAGEIIDYMYEGITLKIADDTRYTPDFFIIYSDHFEFHEVKGFWRDDAKVKARVAKTLFPWFRFQIVREIKGKFYIDEV